MKPNFLIPAVYAGREERIELGSNDLVIPWTHSSLVGQDEVFSVEPTRNGFYAVSSQSPFRRRHGVLFETRMVRLAKVTGYFLREEKLTGPVPCFSYKGIWHRYVMSTYGGIGSVCGEHLYRATELPTTEPTCQACREPFWAVLSVLPYQHPVEARKAVGKARAKQREWERRPTLWDRIHAQDEPPPEVVEDPVHDFDDPVDQDFEDTPEGREAKLQARVRRAKAHETSKESLKKELQAARRHR